MLDDHPNLGDPASERVLFSVDKPQSNHNGGQLQFGPDGLLYISIGMTVVKMTTSPGTPEVPP